jgi:hypothetical protein
MCQQATCRGSRPQIEAFDMEDEERQNISVTCGQFRTAIQYQMTCGVAPAMAG